jgi:hypothetical protein
MPHHLIIENTARQPQKQHHAVGSNRHVTSYPDGGEQSGQRQHANQGCTSRQPVLDKDVMEVLMVGGERRLSLGHPPEDGRE